MPRLDGWGFLQKLRETTALQHLPVVLISASDAQRPEHFPPNVEFDLILGKPLDDEALAMFLFGRLAVAFPQIAERHEGEVFRLNSVPAAKLAKFRELLDEGGVLEIVAWASELAASDEAYAGLARQVTEYCHAANLPALERLEKTIWSPNGVSEN